MEANMALQNDLDIGHCSEYGLNKAAMARHYCAMQQQTHMP
jgi:hypothetical protein